MMLQIFVYFHLHFWLRHYSFRKSTHHSTFSHKHINLTAIFMNIILNNIKSTISSSAVSSEITSMKDYFLAICYCICSVIRSRPP